MKFFKLEINWKVANEPATGISMDWYLYYFSPLKSYNLDLKIFSSVCHWLSTYLWEKIRACDLNWIYTKRPGPLVFIHQTRLLEVACALCVCMQNKHVYLLHVCVSAN